MTIVEHVLFWGIIQSLCVYNTSADVVVMIPRWRVKGFLFTQMIMFPYWCFYGYFDVFKIVFPTFLTIDLITLNLPTYLLVHHIVCLIGHGIACNYNVENFHYYANACAFLEFGSGIFCMYDLRYVRIHSLFIWMTLSNVVATILAYQWYVTENSTLMAHISSFVTLALVGSRQIIVVQEYNKNTNVCVKSNVHHRQACSHHQLGGCNDDRS